MKTIFTFNFFFIYKLYVATCRAECLDLSWKSGMIQKKKHGKLCSVRVTGVLLVGGLLVCFLRY